MGFRKTLMLSPSVLWCLPSGRHRPANRKAARRFTWPMWAGPTTRRRTACSTPWSRALGYKTKIDVLDLPVILEGLKNKKLDLFLDNWLPSNEEGTKPYRDAKTIEELPPDLTDAPYGPVVPNYVAEAGVKDIKDLGPNAAKFEGKFYGIEPGNDGNKIVQKAIDDPKYGHEGLQAGRILRAGHAGPGAEGDGQEGVDRIPRLGTASGDGEDADHLSDRLGSHGFGASQIHPLTRVGYSAECPNLGKLLANLKFTIPMESEVMDGISTNKDKDGDRAGRGLAEGQSGRARQVARRRHHHRWPGWRGGGEEIAGHQRQLTFEPHARQVRLSRRSEATG